VSVYYALGQDKIDEKYKISLAVLVTRIPDEARVGIFCKCTSDEPGLDGERALKLFMFLREYTSVENLYMILLNVEENYYDEDFLNRMCEVEVEE
jgi:hypothetical protein